MSWALLSWDLNTAAGILQAGIHTLAGAKPSFGMAGLKSGGAGDTSVGCWKTACIFIPFVNAERSVVRLQDSEQDVGKSRGAKAKCARALDKWHLRVCPARTSAHSSTGSQGAPWLGHSPLPPNTFSSEAPNLMAGKFLREVVEE